MSMEISYPNTGLIAQNYDAINKANKLLMGKTAKELKVNASGTMQELSAEEVREMREKARNEQRTLNVDCTEIVNNVYCKTGDNITYNVDGDFSNDEMKACKEVVKNAIAALPTKGSDLDYEDYAAMGIAANMVNTYATEHLTEEQAEVVNKSINDYLDSLVQAEKERHAGSGYSVDATENVDSIGGLNEYYAVRQQLSDEAVESLKSQLTSTKLPESTRKTLLANLEHARINGSVVQSASNEQLANTIRTLFQNIDLRDENAVNSAFSKYRELVTPAYRANGIENTMNHDSLSHVLEQDINRFFVQIVNAKAVLKGIGSGVDISV